MWETSETIFKIQELIKIQMVKITYKSIIIICYLSSKINKMINLNFKDL